MGFTFKHAAIGAAAGLVLAIAGCLVWWLGSLVLGASAWDHLHALWPALGVGVVAGGGVAALTALCKPTATPPVDKPTLSKKRRHPLDRDALLATITTSLHWHSTSKRLQRLLRGRLAGKSFFQSIHPEDVAAVDHALTQAHATRQVQRVICRLVVGDPSGAKQTPLAELSAADTSVLPALKPTALVHFQLDVWAKLKRAGKVVRFVCRFIDLTPVVQQKNLELRVARKLLSRAKKKLRALDQDLDRLKSSYRELYQNAPVMYFSLDQNGRFVTFNDTFLHALGYDRQELQSRDYTALLAPATLKSYVTIAENMPSQAGERETQWRKKNGAVFDVWLHTVPVRDEEGRFIRFRNAALDLSEKNRLANELRARGDELERTNQRLRIINSELEAFTHVVSHDLKEPLRTLQAYSNLLAEEHAPQLGPDAFQYVNHLIRASQRLGTLIDELLILGQAGRITREPKRFNLIEIVATVRQDLVDMIQRKEAIVLTEGSLPEVVGDPVRITQLLTNLVANGLKYNQHPAPRVVIGTATNGADSGQVTIFVRDNGIGIDPAFHQQIFGIFRRLHQANEYEGTGAGLAICKKIVEGHGGRIWVESQVGAGATFFFTLPRTLIARPASPRDANTPAGSAKAEAPSSRRGKTQLQTESLAGQTPRIVVVDDQSDVGMIIQKLAKRDGIAVTWFPTAEKAWEYLQQHGPDLLLFDVNLPGISGVELCRRVRTLPHLRDAPIAMFTPVDDAERLQELREAGADFFLTKDLLAVPTDWQQKIRELLAQIRQAAPH
jgi:PAS domain S-box-containing protein